MRASLRQGGNVKDDMMEDGIVIAPTSVEAFRERLATLAEGLPKRLRPPKAKPRQQLF